MLASALWFLPPFGWGSPFSNDDQNNPGAGPDAAMRSDTRGWAAHPSNAVARTALVSCREKGKRVAFMAVICSWAKKLHGFRAGEGGEMPWCIASARPGEINEVAAAREARRGRHPWCGN